MALDLQVFCHVFTAGWKKPLDDLIDGFNASGLKAANPEVRLGIVGPRVGRSAVVAYWNSRCELTPVVDVVAQEGNEALTINAVRDWAKAHPDGATLYCHAKGSARPIPINATWRRIMIEKVIVEWAQVLPELETFQVAGPFWIEAEQMFGGNFWMARNDHLARLPVCQENPRQATEDWIGLRLPDILDVYPGYPGNELLDSLAERYAYGARWWSGSMQGS